MKKTTESISLVIIQTRPNERSQRPLYQHFSSCDRKLWPKPVFWIHTRDRMLSLDH